MGFGSLVSSVVNPGNIIGELTGTTAAAEAASAANTQSMAFQKEMFEEQKKAMQPWQEAGLRGLSGYEELLKDPSKVYSTPGYDFRMGEGLRALDFSGAARGMQLSGAGLKDITRWGQDYASNEYSNTLNRYLSLAGFGNPSAMAQIYGTHGQNIGQGYMNQGAIAGQAATAPFQSALAVGNLAASLMSGGGSPGRGSGTGNLSASTMMAPQNYQFQPLPSLSL